MIKKWFDRLYALMEIYINVQVVMLDAKAMEITNLQQLNNNESLAYPESEFIERMKDLQELSKLLKRF